MKEFVYLFKSLFCLVVLIKSLNFIYIFQIKEYRFDRFFSHLSEEGILSVFYLRPLTFPAKTIRNFLLTIFLFVSLICLFFLPNLIQLILLIFFPFISFIIISFFVLITAIPVYFYRRHIINKAGNLVKKSSAVFIGITGSYGKTSTKEFLYQILSSKFQVAKTEENMNTDIGVALSIIKNLKKDTRFFITEIGAYRIGEIKKVCDFIHPKYAILTSIGNQHINLFGSRKNLIQAKFELINSIPSDGRAFINSDWPEYTEIIKNVDCPITSFSFKQKADLYIENWSVDKNLIKATIKYKSLNPIQLSSGLVSISQFVNLLPCIGLGLDLGVSMEMIKQNIEKIKPLAKRLNLLKGVNQSIILDDSYNSNLNGFLASIETAIIMNKKKAVMISKGIIELGQEKLQAYRHILKCLEKTDMNLFTTDKLFKDLDKKNQVILLSNEEELLKKILKIIDKETLIIVEGKFTKAFIKKIII